MEFCKVWQRRYIFFMGAFGLAMPIGMLIFGPLADYLRIEWMLLGTGIFIVIGNLFLKSNKILLEAGKPVEK